LLSKDEEYDFAMSEGEEGGETKLLPSHMNKVKMEKVLEDEHVKGSSRRSTTVQDHRISVVKKYENGGRVITATDGQTRPSRPIRFLSVR
jgi:hypothetical protein